MRKIILFCWLFCPFEFFAQGFLRTNNMEIVNDKGAFLLKGIGLGGWVLQEPYMLQLSGIARTQQQIRTKIADVLGEESTEKFYQQWIQNGLTRADIDFLASCGFNSIRFPMHYRLFTLPIEDEPIAGENTWIESGFQLTDSLLEWCKAKQLYLMLDLHAAPGGQGNDVAISDASEIRLWQSVENQRKTIALWKKLAERYADEEWIGGYDILNEPNYGFENPDDKNGCSETQNQPLRQLLMEITQTIRTVDTNHLIVISGNCWGNNYNGIFPLWDKNTVISFHKYWNYNDEKEIEFVLQMREEQNAPLWLSESGENSNAWFSDAIRLVEKHNIGWCWWTYKRMGVTCPMEVKIPGDYEKLLEYWRGKGVKPLREQALQIMNQVLENYKFANTVFHKDYIDALFRQTQSDEALPFKNHHLKSKASLTIAAVDYDLGRSGIAYHDNDSANYRTSTQISLPWNYGNVYRNDGVDIFQDVDSGYYVGRTEAGEWLQYTIEVEKAGKYSVEIDIFPVEADGRFHLNINGKDTELQKVRLQKGKNTIRFCIDAGGFHFRSMRVLDGNF
ncbi:MAG: cellulase family glycosylhydrolase [Candidatus Symbiothrix sp.]|jgi:aryl-phospho-beta-D-glucosidase BglC (GH1 family)|nr:cellulase family glycosylhydrolase [Candidatus Symbiothrix sp.]